MSLSPEKININYLKFIEYLQKYNCYSEQMMNDLGEKIKNAPYTMSVEYGGAEQGGLIDVTLNTLCRIGVQINVNVMGTNGKDKIQHPLLYVNPNMLMKVLLLLNIAKADMFIENKNSWQREKLGKMYDFADHKTKLKLGQRSLFICQKYGIKLEEEEFEAFYSMDNVDENGEAFQSPLYTIVKTAKMLTSVELRQKYLQSIKLEIQEL